MDMRKALAALLSAALIHSAAAPSFAQVQAFRTAAPASSVQAVPILAGPGAGLKLTGGASMDIRLGMALPGAVLPTVSAAPANSAPAALTASPISAKVRPLVSAPQAARASLQTSGAAILLSPAAQTPESAAQALLSAETLAAQALKPETAAESSSVELSRFYHSARVRTASDAAVEAPQDSTLRPNALERGTAAAEEEKDEPAAPARSLSRAARYGYVASILGMVMTFGAQIAAAALGYAPHSNYQAPALPASPGLFDTASLVLMVSVFAPIVEELMFRVGLLGGLEWLARKVNGRWAGAAASVLASAVFVVLHETSDPLLIGIRMADALLMAWVYKREGLMASIIQHAVHNGLIAAGMVASLFLGGFSTPFMAAFAVGNLIAAAIFGRGLWKQRADRREGRIARHELTPWTARALAFLLAGSSFFFEAALLKMALMFAVGLLLYSFLKPKDRDELGRL